MRHLLILVASILIVVSGFAQTREDGHRILKENGLEMFPEYLGVGYETYDSMVANAPTVAEKQQIRYIQNTHAIRSGRCSAIFKTPIGILISTSEWITQSGRYKFVTYLYTDFDADFKNGKLSKFDDFFALDYDIKSDAILVDYGILSIKSDDDLGTKMFDFLIYTYNLKTNIKTLQIRFANKSNDPNPRFTANSDSIKGVGVRGNQVIKLK